MNHQIKIYLLVLVFFMLSCSGIGVRGDRVNMSDYDWTVTGKSSQYPDSAYLTALGSGESAETADDNARGELLKLFRVHVVHETETKEIYQEKQETGRTDFIKQGIDAEQITRSATKGTLEGVIIVKRMEKQGKNFSLAVIEKGKAAKSVRAKISEIDQEISKLTKDLDNQPDSIEKARKLTAMLKHLLIRDDLSLQLRVLTGTIAKTASVNLFEVEEALNELFKKEIRFGLKIEGEKGTDIAFALKEELGKRGFIVAEVPPFHIMITGNYSAEQIKRPPDEWVWVAYNLNLSAFTLKDNNIIATTSIKNQVGHKSMAQAFDRALFILKKEHVKKIVDALCKSLFNGDKNK